MDKDFLLTKKTTIIICYSIQESKAVKRGIQSLREDIKKVVACQCMEMFYEEEKEEVNFCIMAGTIGKNAVIDKKIEQGLLKVDPILDENGNYRWEGYVIQKIENKLYIVGSDRRGTIYGIYEFSRWLGVSPWYYFGDVPIQKKQEMMIPSGFYKADYPSVQYRGIFINDEEELEAWAKEHTRDNAIGPEIYEKIFELLLRLKANYIWPAMHVNYFNENPLNGALADEMGIVVGTSHCDMLLRSNQNEWNPWVLKKGYHKLKYDYSIEGENRERIKEYWKESLEQNRDYENTYTIGMRGIHDSGFVASKIDENTQLDKKQIQKEKIKLMQKVFADQRTIIREVLGKEKAEKAVQVFIPYKEVLDLYDAGLDVPEDVTMIWVNDNFGHMRRYPNKEELTRKGGHGLYFHNSYWAHPEMSYLFINSIPLAQTGNELEKAYKKGIHKLWVLNVGAIKPLEMDMEYFICYGWEAGKEKAITKNPEQFVEEWVNHNFSGEFGKEAADLYGKYAQITNVRKVEHLVSDVFAQEGYGDEAGRRLNELKDLYDRGNQIWHCLPNNEKDSFFELFLMKIHASFWSNAEYYFADRSRLCYNRGLGKAADYYINCSRIMMDCRRKMLYFYNYIICNGKWSHILTPEAFPPPKIPLYPAGKPALLITGKPHMSVITWDGEKIEEKGELIFYESGIQRKWIEIGNMGSGELEYKIQGHKDTWITISQARGKIKTEKRIYIETKKDYHGEQKEILLELYTENGNEKKLLSIKKKCHNMESKDFHGCIEADGGIAIPAVCFYRAKNIQVISGLGRMSGDAVMALPKKEKKSVLEYTFYTYSYGEFEVEISRYVTLNSCGRIRMEVKIDENTPVILESAIIDEWKKGWKESILNNGEKLSFIWHNKEKGIHTLIISIPDEFVTIDRINIYTMPRKKNNLGLLCTLKKDGYDMVYPKDMPEIDIDKIQQETECFYQITCNEIPLPNQVYAGKNFWKIDRLYAHNEEYPQKRRGKKRNYSFDEQTEKNVIKEITKTDLRESQGRLCIEAEYVLAESNVAWRTFSKDGKQRWEHLQSETAGRTGLAMQLEQAGVIYEKPEDAPGLNYRITIQHEGVYHVWLLLYIPDDRSDLFVLAVDGIVQPLQEQFSKGGQFTYGTSHIYYWNLISDIQLTSQEHVFSIFPIKSGFRVDRIYLTMGEELPPNDYEWDKIIR